MAVIPSGKASGTAPWATSITVEELGPAHLKPIAGRMLVPMFGEESIHAAEKVEEDIFASWGGKYVDTGATKASLTDSSAAGAIRHLTPGSLQFGTSIWYARFQGTTGLGKHSPPSAILKPTALEAAAAARDLKDFILHGSQEMLA